MVDSTRASSRKARVYVFREFLMRTYGEYLKPGSIVLDAAGGKGDLSWLLRNVDAIDSTVVDPRVVKDHISKSVRYLRQHPEEAQKRCVPGLPTYQPLAMLLPKLDANARVNAKTNATIHAKADASATTEDNADDVEFCMPKHLRILMTQQLVDATKRRLEDGAGGKVGWLEFWEDALEQGKKAQPLGYSEEHFVSEGQIDDAEAAWETVTGAKLIVGFHPDQATDCAIDLALVLGIPFCVVPCCVFPNEFPDRVHPANGGKVRLYPELLQYLKEKCGDTRTHDLPFHFSTTSKNVVLYTVPKSN